MIYYIYINKNKEEEEYTRFGVPEKVLVTNIQLSADEKDIPKALNALLAYYEKEKSTS
jgi:hypothetical protein